MASIENYIPVTTGKKKRSTLGKIADGVGNYYTGMADAGLGILGMGDIINEKSYRGDNADKWDKGTGIVSKVGQVAGSVALTMATGGAAAPSLGVALGGALLSKSFESGGYRSKEDEDFIFSKLHPNGVRAKGINLNKGGGYNINYPAGKLIKSLPIIDAVLSIIPLVQDELDIKNSNSAKSLRTQKEVEYKRKRDIAVGTDFEKMIALSGGLFESGGMRNIASEDNELIELQGNTHAQGGINIGNGDEAEGKETIFNSGDSGQFIFSEKLKLPNSKKSFADESKKIEKEYKNNKDSLREKAMKQRIGNLANLQESIKPKEKILGNKFDDGGNRNRVNPFEYANSFADGRRGEKLLPSLTPITRENSNFAELNSIPLTSKSKSLNFPSTSIFNLADALAFNPKLSKSEPFQFNNNNGLIKGNKLGENIGKQTVDFSKLKATSPEGLQAEETSTGFKNMSALPQMIGYGAQALANIPGLFTKPERVKYDRVTPDLINLGVERDALSQDRNLSRAISRKLATGSSNIGQALNFLGANESDLSRQFGQNISKSFQTEANLNSEIKNKTRMFNAEISRAEQDANAAEKDAAKSARLQSLSNIGSIAALGAKDFMDMTYKYDQLSALDTGDFVMVRDKETGKLVQKEKKYNADGTWDGKSFK